MSIPNSIAGYYGQEKETYAIKPSDIALGQKMELPDGRSFRLALAGGVALTPGLLVSPPSTANDHGASAGSGMVIPTAVAVGDTSITVTNGATTAVTKDMFAEGFITTQVGTGLGYVYKIKSCASAAVSATVTLNLYETDHVAATVAAGTTKAGLKKNPYSALVVFPAGTIVGPPMGIPPTACASSYYFWLQRHGEVQAGVSATVLVTGAPVCAATALNGFVGPVIANSALYWQNTPIGFALNSVTAAEYATIFLTLE